MTTKPTEQIQTLMRTATKIELHTSIEINRKAKREAEDLIDILRAAVSKYGTGGKLTIADLNKRATKEERERAEDIIDAAAEDAQTLFPMKRKKTRKDLIETEILSLLLSWGVWEADMLHKLTQEYAEECSKVMKHETQMPLRLDEEDLDIICRENNSRISQKLMHDFLLMTAGGVDDIEIWMATEQEMIAKRLKYEAKRIQYSEDTLLMNKAQTHGKPKDAEYILHILDSRACSACKAINGHRYKIKDIVVGVNFPPLHPNCRCWIEVLK